MLCHGLQAIDQPDPAFPCLPEPLLVFGQLSSRLWFFPVFDLDKTRKTSPANTSIRSPAPKSRKRKERATKRAVRISDFRMVRIYTPILPHSGLIVCATHSSLDFLLSQTTRQGVPQK